jgi:hypothetical protein
VIDEGDPSRRGADGITRAPWLIDDAEDGLANKQRLYFVSAVLKRLRHLNEGEMRKVESYMTTAPDAPGIGRFVEADPTTTAPRLRKREVCFDESHKGYGRAGCLDCAETP